MIHYIAVVIWASGRWMPTTDWHRAEIESNVTTRCGQRPRNLWFTSAYHDVAADVQLMKGYGAAELAMLPGIVRWLETLAPWRAWVSRHSPAMKAGIWGVAGLSDRKQLERPTLWNLTGVEAFWRSETERRKGWSYFDHRDAWGCEISDDLSGEEFSDTVTVVKGSSVHPELCGGVAPRRQDSLLTSERAIAIHTTPLFVKGKYVDNCLPYLSYLRTFATAALLLPPETPSFRSGSRDTGQKYHGTTGVYELPGLDSSNASIFQAFPSGQTYNSATAASETSTHRQTRRNDAAERMVGSLLFGMPNSLLKHYSRPQSRT